MPQLKKGVFGNVSVLKKIPVPLFRELFQRTGALTPELEPFLAPDGDGGVGTKALATLFYEHSDELSDDLLSALLPITQNRVVLHDLTSACGLPHHFVAEGVKPAALAAGCGQRLRLAARSFASWRR